MKLEIGMKVMVNDDLGVCENRIGVITQIRDGKYTYPIMVKFTDKVYDEAFKESDISVIHDEIIKSTSAIEYCNGSTIRWDFIDNLNLNVSINGRVNIVALCKILLKYVDGLSDFKYKRVCPYKIIHEYARDREDKRHLFSIKYLTIQEEVKQQDIMYTDYAMFLSGEYNFFIPDLLEVAKDRKLVILSDDVYVAIDKKLKNISASCKEVKVIDRKALENDGWTVPSQFEKYFKV